MGNHDRWRGDRGGQWRGYDRGGFDPRPGYETDYDRYRGRNEPRWDEREDLARGGREHPEWGSYPYHGRGREDRSGEYAARRGRWPAEGPGYDRGGGYGGGQDRRGGGWRERGDIRGRSVSELAFGRDASGRDDDWDEWGSPRGGDRDRGFLDRAGDEIASWFGDDEAARRRRQDEREDERGYGEHRGRGPKSYQRSDDRIREDVNDRLTDDPMLDASDIEVSVAGREVTLSGTVRQRWDKRRAEDLAESVSGVLHVQNNLRVQPQAPDFSSVASGPNVSATASAASPRRERSKL